MSTARAGHQMPDPYAEYARLRARGALCACPFGGWFVTRYDDVRAAFRDRRLRSLDIVEQLSNKQCQLARIAPAATPGLASLIDNVGHWLAFIEPPDHSRFKGPIASSLKKANIDRLRPGIRDSAVALLGKVLPQGCMDVMHDFAHHLPIRVIAQLLGLPPREVQQFNTWAMKIAGVLTPALPLTSYRAANDAAREVINYLGYLLDERRRQPGDDLLSAMVAGGEVAPFSNEEAAATCVSLFAAGVETSTSLLGSGLLALLRHPSQLALLMENPTLLPNAVEELLRYEPSVQFTSRVAREDFEWHQQRIRQGEMVHLLIGAANRDPDKFLDAETLDVRRQPNLHLTFGAGHHFCVGAPLARVMAETALEVLFTTLPNLRLATTPPTYSANPVVRELATLPVVFDREPKVMRGERCASSQMVV